MIQDLDVTADSGREKKNQDREQRFIGSQQLEKVSLILYHNFASKM